MSHNESYRHLLLKAKAFYDRSNARGFLAIFTDWFVISLFFSTYFLFSVLSLYAFVPIYLVSCVFIASRIRGLECLVHEASHWNLFATRSWNEKVSVIFATPVLRVVEDYRPPHNIHHRDLGDLQVDPDIIRYERLGVNDLPKNWFWIVILRPLFGYHSVEYFKTIFKEFCLSPTKRLEKIAFWVAVILFIALSKSWMLFFFYWFVPFFVFLPIQRFWAEAAKHSSLDLNKKVGSSRNNIGPLHRLILHPHGDGYHQVHHLSPSIPWFNLAKAHKELMKDPYYRSECIGSNKVSTTWKQMQSRGILKIIQQRF